MDSKYVALQGVRTLSIHSTAPEAPYPKQEITISPTEGLTAELAALAFDPSPSCHMTLLDVALLNGLSALKAYTVVGPPAQTVTQHFPHLAPPPSVEPVEPAAEHLQNLLMTFVY